MSKSRRAVLTEALPAAQKWRQIIDAQRASGCTIAAYCRDHAISPPSFFAWKRRLGGPITTPFVEVKTMPGDREPSSGIELRLPGRRRIRVRRGFDRDLLMELVRTLEAIA